MSGRLLVRRQKRCWLAIAALAGCGCAAALNPELTIKELHDTAWGASQGAPLRGAATLAQTNDGNLWIASPSGFSIRRNCVRAHRTAPRPEALVVECALGFFFSARRGFVGRLRVWTRSAPQGGHWQVFSVADASPTNCMSGYVAIRVPIPDRNNGWLSTERIRITSVVVVLPSVGVLRLLDVS